MPELCSTCSITKDNLAIPDFGNNGMIQSVPSDPLLRSLTVELFDRKRLDSNQYRRNNTRFGLSSFIIRWLLLLFFLSSWPHCYDDQMHFKISWQSSLSLTKQFFRRTGLFVTKELARNFWYSGEKQIFPVFNITGISRGETVGAAVTWSRLGTACVLNFQRQEIIKAASIRLKNNILGSVLSWKLKRRIKKDHPL